MGFHYALGIGKEVLSGRGEPQKSAMLSIEEIHPLLFLKLQDILTKGRL